MRAFLGIGASLLFLYLAFRNVTLQAVWLVLEQAQIFWVVIGLISVAANTLFKVIRWKVMLGPPGQGVAFSDLTMALLSGQMLNVLFPARIGDLSRAYVIGGMGPGRTFVLGTVLLEKIIDTLWYALLFILLLALMPLPEWINNSGLILGFAAFFMILVTFLMAYRRSEFLRLSNLVTRRFPSNLQTYINSRLQSGLSSLDVLQKRTDLLKIGMWSGLIWLTALLTNYFVMLALDIHLSFSASLLILVGLIAGIALPSIPGRIGLFEYICVLALSLYNIGPTLALSYGLLLHAIVFIPTTLLGILSFWIFSHRGLKSVPPSTNISDLNNSNYGTG